MDGYEEERWCVADSAARGDVSGSTRGAWVRWSYEQEELGAGGAMAMDCACEQEGLYGGGKQKEEETDVGDTL